MGSYQKKERAMESETETAAMCEPLDSAALEVRIISWTFLVSKLANFSTCNTKFSGGGAQTLFTLTFLLFTLTCKPSSVHIYSAS
jgi:hypothetical protein